MASFPTTLHHRAPTEYEQSTSTRACDRCGVRRQVKATSPLNLCIDCKTGLTKFERQAWSRNTP